MTDKPGLKLDLYGDDRTAFVVGLLLALNEHFKDRKELREFMIGAYELAESLCMGKLYDGTVDARIIETIRMFVADEADGGAQVEFTQPDRP